MAGRGIGRALLERLFDSTEQDGIWTIQTGVFPENEASLALHAKCGFRVVGTQERLGKLDGVWRDVVVLERRSEVIDMTKVEAVVVRERVETVIDAVEAETGHVGVTVVEAIGHGRQRGVTHEYRGRVFESRFLPKALLMFVVEDSVAAGGRRGHRGRCAAGTSRATGSSGPLGSRTSRTTARGFRSGKWRSHEDPPTSSSRSTRCGLSSPRCS